MFLKKADKYFRFSFIINMTITKIKLFDNQVITLIWLKEILCQFFNLYDVCFFCFPGIGHIKRRQSLLLHRKQECRKLTLLMVEYAFYFSFKTKQPIAIIIKPSRNIITAALKLPKNKSFLNTTH